MKFLNYILFSLLAIFMVSCGEDELWDDKEPQQHKVYTVTGMAIAGYYGDAVKSATIDIYTDLSVTLETGKDKNGKEIKNSFTEYKIIDLVDLSDSENYKFSYKRIQPTEEAKSAANIDTMSYVFEGSKSAEKVTAIIDGRTGFAKVTETQKGY